MIVTDRLSEIQVSFHPKISQSKRTKVKSSQEAYDIIKTLWNDNTIQLYEEFLVLYLSRNNGVIGYRFISKGSNCGTVVNVQLILAIALKINCSSLILSHNHPSGNLHPSQADIELTKKISEACKLLDLQLLDHLIVTLEKYFSFADEGLIWTHSISMGFSWDIISGV